MAISTSNTFIEPTAGTSLNAARSQINSSLRALLSNFYSTNAPPIGVNIVASGAQLGAQNGLVYHNANALYVSDSVNVKATRVGGNFTRAGIGSRNENGIASLAANALSYENGELVSTISEAGGLKANARLYLCTGNSVSAGNMTDFIDVGIPPTNGSIVTTMVADDAITNAKINASTVNLDNLLLIDGTKAGADGNAPANAQIALGTTTGNTAISLGSLHSSNVTLKHQRTGTVENAGLSIMDNTGVKFAPVAANLVCQSTITGTDTAVAPIVPCGSIIMWTNATAPTGFLECKGDAISRTTYAALFAVLGTTYGAGNGSSTFNVPDFQGRHAAGVSSNVTIGEKSTEQITSGNAYGGSVSVGLTVSTSKFQAVSGIFGGSDAAVGVSVSSSSAAINAAFVGVKYIIKT